ncbi:MAG: hypothetical protein AAFZ52_10610, partial [Bacteroidota bacterium]
MSNKVLLLFLLLYFGPLSAQKIAVDVNFDVAHVLGEVTTFEREKFITVHADVTTRDWFETDNALADVADDFLNGYDVYMGRNTGA